MIYLLYDLFVFPIVCLSNRREGEREGRVRDVILCCIMRCSVLYTIIYYVYIYPSYHISSINRQKSLREIVTIIQVNFIPTFHRGNHHSKILKVRKMSIFHNRTVTLTLTLTNLYRIIIGQAFSLSSREFVI